MKKYALGVLTLAVGSLLTACGGGSGSSGATREALINSKPIINHDANNNGNADNGSNGNSANNDSTNNDPTNNDHLLDGANSANDATDDMNAGSTNGDSANAGAGDNATAPTTPTPDPVPSPKTTKYGQVIAQPKGRDISRDMLKTLDVSDVQVLNVNGRSFALGGILDDGKIDKHTYNLNHVSYGLVDDYAQGSSRTEYAYYQGERTVNMPTSGTAIYRGGLALTCNGCGSIGKHYHAGTSSFKVDFGAKTVTGSLSALNKTLEVKGDIKGSTFDGKHKNTTITGAFFGDNAQEMAGLFYHENGNLEAGGAFGATKQ